MTRSICLDSNIIIYLAKSLADVNIIKNQHIIYSSIVKIEVLCYEDMTVTEQKFYDMFFDEAQHAFMDDIVINLAIDIRQRYKTKLGDAIIAATATAYDSILWTTNTKHFKVIEGLKLHNPLLSK